jgi:hypothetical protein
MPLVFPSMPKGEIVGQLVLVFIDVNPWRLMSTLGEVWKTQRCDRVNPWRSMEAPEMWMRSLDNWLIVGQLVVICMVDIVGKLIDVIPRRILRDGCN